MSRVEDSARLLISGGATLTLDGSAAVLPAPGGDVLIVDGRIAAVGEIPESARQSARTLDADGCVVIPGLVQSHMHLCQTLFRNQADDLDLLDWLSNRIWPLESAHDEASMAASVDLGIAELLAGGTTAILDMGTVRHTEVIFERAAHHGIRMTGGKALMDTGENVPPALLEDRYAALEESAALSARYHGEAEGRLRYAYCPRFLLSCSDDLLDETATRIGAAGVMLHTHAAENRRELELVRARTGQDNIDALASRNLLGSHTVLAHGIWVSESERAEMAATHTGVAHCPSSNLKLGSGICDVPALIAAGVRVGLGADGAPCNNRLDAFSEMRLAALLQKPRYVPSTMAALDVLRMATIEGAHLLGLADEIGSIEVGKRADIAVVELDAIHTTPVNSADLAGALVYSATAADVRHTLVDGIPLYENHRLVRADAVEIASRAREQLPRVLARAGLAR